MAAETATIVVTGYLPKEVVDNDHRSARVAKVFIRGVVKDAGGSLTKLDVLMGVIFITLKDQTGVAELKAALTPIAGVTVSEPSQAQLIFTKEKARVEADILAKEAELQAK